MDQEQLDKFTENILHYYRQGDTSCVAIGMTHDKGERRIVVVQRGLRRTEYHGVSTPSMLRLARVILRRRCSRSHYLTVGKGWRYTEVSTRKERGS